MFDVGFSEVIVCFLVALVVLGPEKLPKVARAVGRWTGMAKSYMRNLSTELEREMQTTELRQQLAETQKMLQEQSVAAQKSMQQLSAPVGNILEHEPAKPAAETVTPPPEKSAP